MLETSVIWRDKAYAGCREYDTADEPRILDVFFFWKTAVLLADKSKSKKPQLPETFSEPFVCLVCGLLHKIGTGPDAFRRFVDGQVKAVEIKATVTGAGFTDAKRDLKFDELYWLSLENYQSLQFQIYRFEQQEIGRVVEKSQTRRDRGTLGLKRLAQSLKREPLLSGKIGFVLTSKLAEDHVDGS